MYVHNCPKTRREEQQERDEAGAGAGGGGGGGGGGKCTHTFFGGGAVAAVWADGQVPGHVRVRGLEVPRPANGGLEHVRPGREGAAVQVPQTGLSTTETGSGVRGGWRAAACRSVALAVCLWLSLNNKSKQGKGGPKERTGDAGRRARGRRHQTRHWICTLASIQNVAWADAAAAAKGTPWNVT
ncbi:hypothetical protein CDD83_879 [Cordyceps sp. RAO-2017]|nr:hypothetical protein CDD83_879 [Cordyceps sp. RAO-2017]